MKDKNGEKIGYNPKRVTKVWAILRKYYLYELPQLINVLKGIRFIRNYWNKKAQANLVEKQGVYEFNVSFTGFPELGNKTSHPMIVQKVKSSNFWFIQDYIKSVHQYLSQQNWHFNPSNIKDISIHTEDSDGKILEPIIEEKWCSIYYGELEKSILYTF